jgi:hypothetical protein
MNSNGLVQKALVGLNGKKFCIKSGKPPTELPASKQTKPL